MGAATVIGREPELDSIEGFVAAIADGPAAMVLQAVLFGLVHIGPDFANPVAAVPVLAAMVAGGLVAGLIVQRTGSLLFPFAIHVALDVPLYYAVACRLTG